MDKKRQEKETVLQVRSRLLAQMHTPHAYASWSHGAGFKKNAVANSHGYMFMEIRTARPVAQSAKA